jgi:hypothetical protein
MNSFEGPAKQEPTPEELMTPKQREMSEDREEQLEKYGTDLVSEYFGHSPELRNEVRRRWPDAVDAHRLTGAIKSESGKLEKVQLVAVRYRSSKDNPSGWEYMGTIDGQPASAERAKELFQQDKTTLGAGSHKWSRDRDTLEANAERDQEFPKNVTNEGGL